MSEQIEQQNKDGIESSSSSSSKNHLRLNSCPEIRSAIHNLSRLLNTGLDQSTLDICIELLESGIHPSALAEIIRIIRRELKGLKETENEDTDSVLEFEMMKAGKIEPTTTASLITLFSSKNSSECSIPSTSSA